MKRQIKYYRYVQSIALLGCLLVSLWLILQYICKTLYGYNVLESIYLGFLLMIADSVAGVFWIKNCCNKNEINIWTWMKETNKHMIVVGIFYIIVLVLTVNSEMSYFILPAIAGNFLLFNLHGACYLFLFRITKNIKLAQIVCYILCISEFVTIIFVPESPKLGAYDIANLFSGFRGLASFDSAMWIVKMLVIILLIYAAVFAGEKESLK